MIRKTTMWALALILCGTGSAHAWRIFDSLDKAQEIMKPVRPGQETAALKPLDGSFRLDGSIPKRTIAKDQEEMKTAGIHHGTWILNGNFLQIDLAEKATVGKHSLVWSAKVLMGWDSHDKVYRAAIADSQGTLGLLEGKLVDKKLMFNLVSKNTLAGEPFNYRIQFDLTDPDAILFTSEVQDKEKWVLTEKKTLVRTGTTAP